MNIINEIKRAQLAFDTVRPSPEVKARGIFLGAAEWRALQAHASEVCTFVIPDHVFDECKRVEFGGVPCFKVETQSMLFVA